MAAFVPPLWSKLGNGLKDLLTKKYDYKHSLTTKNNVQSDLTVESTAFLGDHFGDFSGLVKAKYKNKDLGEFEGQVETNGNLQGELKATKLYDGLTLVVKGTQKPTGKVTAEYKRQNVSTSVSADVSKDFKTVLEGTLVGGFDGFSVGGQVAYDTAAADVSDYNFGAEYVQGDFVATVKTAEKADKVSTAYLYTLPSSSKKLKTQVGAGLTWDLGKNKRVLTIGSEHDVDENTSGKTKIDSEGNVAGAVEHRLSNPNVKIALSASWNGKQPSTVPDKFGVAATYGDF
jgi:voltage-dependent anion channel protein 2